jgi:hypothetical protein
VSPKFLEKQSTQREMLRNYAGFAGSALLAQLFPASLLSAGVPGLRQQASTPPTDSLAAMRAQMGSAPIQSQPLAENLTLLCGPGGNIVVLDGPDAKIVVDTFLMPAWPKLKRTPPRFTNSRWVKAWGSRPSRRPAPVLACRHTPGRSSVCRFER